MSELRAVIVGASGYAGGELLRLLQVHPHVEVVQATSESQRGRPVPLVHPNLRGFTDLKFCGRDELEPCDVVFLAMPHGQSQSHIETYFSLAPLVIDVAADFRIQDPDVYQHYYGDAHQRPDLLEEAVWAVPEFSRDRIPGARLLVGAGCLATCTSMALKPLFAAGLVDAKVVAEGKLGSSAAGNKPNLGSHHPERSGVVRSFKPTRHRHTAEVRQAIAQDTGSTPELHLSATSVELVRGILVTAHLFPAEGRKLTDKDLWRAYRSCWKEEPFVRIVKQRSGVYRYPEPRIVAGTNFCDVGFELDPDTGRVVAIAALDNLVKGTAGNVIQALNIHQGWDERTGLWFPGLHP